MCEQLNSVFGTERTYDIYVISYFVILSIVRCICTDTNCTLGYEN